MSIQRIKAILIQEFYITIRSVEVINDLFFFPIFANIIIFGFLTLYLTSVVKEFKSSAVLIGMIFWQPVWIISYSIGVGTLWNVWSKNLTNMFITPVTLPEYFTAYGISGVIKGLIVLLASSILASTIFHTDILRIGVPMLIVYFCNVSLFGFSIGIFILGLIFRFGTRIAALSWGITGVLQPLMAVVYPVRILPQPFQSLAWIFPPTYVFESARNSIAQIPETKPLLLYAVILNIIYFIISIIFFRFMFNKSKEVGQFSKLEL